MRFFGKVLNCLLFLAVLGSIKCDYYTSITGLENLLSVEVHYINALEKHLAEVEKLHKEFQSLLDEVDLKHSGEQNSSAHYLDDPINAFKTIRKLVVDFQQLQHWTEQIQEIKVYNELSILPHEGITLPTDDDLKGAAMGLSRLQRMYKLDSTSLAKGYLMDQKYSSEMSVYNCFVLGESLYEAEEYHYASEWLIEALHKVEDLENDAAVDDNELELKDDEDFDDDDDDEDDFDQDEKEAGIYPYATAIQILEYLAPALYMANNRELAFEMNSELLELDPENKEALANSLMFETGVKAERRRMTLKKPSTATKLERLYGQVCSGELQQSAEQKRHLRCRYVTNNVPYYLVGPLKMEELNLEPFVVYYHEIIYDSEINEIINEAEASMETSKVGITAMSRFDDIRISKNSWLRFKEHSFLDKIAQRLEDITGLSIESGEPLQVANYGIGGHYGPHHDFSEDPEGDYHGAGNRILTALFYINDVELGGGTAFPALSLLVPPVRRSLVVWYNLHKSLESDFRTWHAGCPVLKGSKWICNEWFHTVGQEFKYPCGLQADDAVSEPYKFWNRQGS